MRIEGGGGVEDMDGLLTSDPIASSSCKKKRLNPDKNKKKE